MVNKMSKFLSAVAIVSPVRVAMGVVYIIALIVVYADIMIWRV